MSRHRFLGSAAALGMLMLASPGGASETTTYSYDAHGRLVKVQRAGAVNDGVVADYTFDQADNRTNVTVTGVGTPGGVSFSIGNASATEGGIVQFTVTKTGTASGTLTVQYATATGTAGTSDFTAASGTLSFAQNETSKTINVQTTQDTAVEGNETFTATLSNPSAGATIGTATGTGTIVDDDSAPGPSFAVGDASVTEGGNLVFTVSKSGSGSGSVQYATANGTATAGSDYTAKSLTTLSFTSAETSKTVSVTTLQDTTDEPNETLSLNLSNPSSGASISDNQGLGTIVDDDDPAPTTLQVPSGGSQNLRTIADNNGYTGASGVTYVFEVAGVVTGTAGTAGTAGATAIDTGTWPTGVTLTLKVKNGGVVSGGGGGGGNGGYNGGAGQAGGAGGDAFYARTNISVVVDAGGIVRAGGGGGGGGSSATFTSPAGSGTVGGSGGGGGAPNGAGGAGRAGTNGGNTGSNGSAGTTSGGGAGGTTGGPAGGNGGTYAAAGTAGTAAASSGGAGGAAGFAIRKNGNTVTVTNNGTITGTQQ